MNKLILLFTFSVLCPLDAPNNAQDMFAATQAELNKYYDPYKSILKHEFSYVAGVRSVAQHLYKQFDAHSTNVMQNDLILLAKETGALVKQIEQRRMELYILICQESHDKTQLVRLVQGVVENVFKLVTQSYQAKSLDLGDLYMSYPAEVIRSLRNEISSAQAQHDELYDRLKNSRLYPLAQPISLERRNTRGPDPAKMQFRDQCKSFFEQEICKINFEACDVCNISKVLQINTPRYEYSEQDQRVLKYLYVFKLLLYAYQLKRLGASGAVKVWSAQLLDTIVVNESIDTVYANNQPLDFISKHWTVIAELTKEKSLTMCDHKSRELARDMFERQLITSKFLFYIYIQLMKNSLINHKQQGSQTISAVIKSHTIKMLDKIMLNSVFCINDHTRDALVALLQIIPPATVGDILHVERIVMERIYACIEDAIELTRYIHNLRCSGSVINHYLLYAPYIYKYLVLLNITMKDEYYTKALEFYDKIQGACHGRIDPICVNNMIRIAQNAKLKTPEGMK